jgi:TusE/DsrC/DsvC family sulfur relay protein
MALVSKAVRLQDYLSRLAVSKEETMSLEVNGVTIETDEHGNLVNLADWTEDVAHALAAADDTMSELTTEHFDVIEYLREQYFDHNEQPMERVIMKGMSKIWNKKISSKDLYNLYPGAPSKQGNRIAGLPYVARKGGY